VSLVDTVEVKVSPNASFSPVVFDVIQELHSSSPQIRFSTSPEYAAVVDLRTVNGAKALVHLHAKGGEHGHKIQLVDAGESTRGQMLDTVAGIVNEHPEFLELGRVDLCANIEGVGVPWFAKSVRARWSQWQAQIGEVTMNDADGRRMQWSEMGRRTLQTMYLGKKPNCFRVYDKLAERRAAYALDLARHVRQARGLHGIPEGVALDVTQLPAGGPSVLPRWDPSHRKEREGYTAEVRAELLKLYPFPSFEEWFLAQCTGGMTGVVAVESLKTELVDRAEQLSLVPRIPRILTRVERQMGGGRVPGPVDTFSKLFSNGRDFNPFERLQFIPAASSVVDPSAYSVVDYAAGIKFREWLESGELTYQGLYAMWNARSGNAVRLAPKFAPFLRGLPGVDEGEGDGRASTVTAAELFEQYRDTFSRQLAA
jgi:hypothetical protein